MSDDLRELYQEVILDHGRHPRNFGALEKATHVAHGHNPLCGDQLDVYLVLDGGGSVADVAFKGKGCAISMASASLMTEIMKGKTETQAKAVFEHFHAMCAGEDESAGGGGNGRAAISEEDEERLQVMAGVRQFPMRVKCATLAWHTLRAAMAGEGTISTEDGGAEDAAIGNATVKDGAP